MATQVSDPPSPAAGPEIKLSGRGGSRMNVPDSVIAAVEAEANKGAPAAPEPAAAPPAPPEPPKPAPTPPAGNGTPAKAPEVKAPVPATPPTPPKSDKEENLANLRKKLEAREAEFATLQNSATATAKEKADADLKRAEAEAKLQAALEREEKDYKPVIERLKTTEQELNKQREVLKMKAYQETPEFHEKFIAPIIETQRDIADFIAQVEVPTETGRRVATMQDFNVVMSAGSHTAAREIAKQIFGEDAPTILQMRLRLQSRNKSREEAHKRAGEMAIEYEQRTQSALLQQQQQFKGSVYAEAERLLKETLQIDDTDPEEKAALAEAQSFADGLWNSDNETVEQVVKKAAKARKNNIEAPVLRKRLDRATKKIAELEDQLKQYQKSEPQLEPRGGGSAPSTPADGDRPERAALLAAAQAAATATH